MAITVPEHTEAMKMVFTGPSNTEREQVRESGEDSGALKMPMATRLHRWLTMPIHRS